MTSILCTNVVYNYIIGKEANKSSNYGKDDSMYETVQYENAAASVATSYKQSSAHDGRLSPTKSVTPTHKIVTDR